MSDLVSVYFSPGRDPEGNIVGFIRACEKTLDVAIYSFTSPEICTAVLDADKRGVDVRLILDYDQGYSRFSAYTKWLKPALGNIQVKFKTAAGLMHNKFAVGDRSAVLTGSYNWTETAEKVNHENLVIIRDKEAVEKFVMEFDYMWRTIC